MWLLWLQKQKMGKNGCSQKDVILGRPRNFDVCRAPIKILPGDREKSPFRGKPPPFSRLWSEVFAPSPWFHWATENHIFLVALVFDKKGSISSTIATKTTHFLCTKSCCLLIFTPSLFAPLFGRTPPPFGPESAFWGGSTQILGTFGPQTPFLPESAYFLLLRRAFSGLPHFLFGWGLLTGAFGPIFPLFSLCLGEWICKQNRQADH